MNGSPTARLRRLCLAVALAAGCTADPPAQVRAGDPAPAFTTDDLAGAPVSFDPEAAGQPLVVRFWADWCSFCEGEMKMVEGVWRARRERGLRVFAINAGQSRDTAAAFIERLGVTYPALLDPDSSIARRYGVTGLPTTFFIDARGRVQRKLVGEASEAVFAAAVDALMATP